ncbi:MAG: 3-dehydroquinate synthase [Clostridia bacterium]|nr:3-dehydroquinate synthase [Clostridia bacterium]
MLTLKVNASKNYDIILSDNLSQFSLMASHVNGSNVLIVTDDNVNALYGGALDNYFTGKNVFTYVLPHGEENKNGENYFKIINFLAENGFTRNDAVVTFGGGVVGDIVAFVASTYMRGITLIAVPTTLLSAVDSSVGGKTGIDLPSGKNLCGTFYQPNAVYINVNFLKTLPNREVVSGMGEVIKYAFLSDTVNSELISKGVTKELIYNCLQIKANVVNNDEFENGLRMILNLGHTVGHAIESLSGYNYSHGECVAKGINYAIKLSKKVLNLSDNVTTKLYGVLNLYNFDLTCNFTAKELVNQIKKDKKSTGDSVNFVLVEDVAKPVVKKISYTELENLL